MQAVFQYGPRQYLVSEGDILDLPLSKDKSHLEISDVLLVIDGENVLVGQPTVAGYSVKCEFIQDVKGQKIRVLKYKAKSRYRKVTGFRPKFSRFKVTSISSNPPPSTRTKPRPASPQSSRKTKTTPARETKS